MELDFIHETKQRQSKPRYCKPASVKVLERLHFERKKMKHPDIPYPVRTTFRDDKANDLTRCIIAWLQLNGHFGGRVNTGGTYSEKLGKYIRSGSKKGMADITAVMNGKHVSIEVKTGRDRIRENQMKVKQEIERAGGVYIVVHSFDDFLEQIKRLLTSAENSADIS